MSLLLSEIPPFLGKNVEMCTPLQSPKGPTDRFLADRYTARALRLFDFVRNQTSIDVKLQPLRFIHLIGISQPPCQVPDKGT